MRKAVLARRQQRQHNADTSAKQTLQTMHASSDLKLIVCISSAASNLRRRRALRRTWFTFKTRPSSWLTEDEAASLQLIFVVSAGDPAVQAEQAEYGDLLLVEAAEGYEHLWRKALVSMQLLEKGFQYQYYMHADDDSYVRLDLVMKLLAGPPRQRFYWGYVWNDSCSSRTTEPIRNPLNKSYMPVDQYALDYYPPFASGCGFILSRDLVHALLKQPLPDYRLLDPPFGIHLCGRDSCVLPEGPVVPVHDPCVRPYRGIPIFKPNTVVQHYLTPEEMAPFHAQVLDHLSKPLGAITAMNPQQSALEQTSAAQDSQPGPGPVVTAADQLYGQLVQMGLLRR